MARPFSTLEAKRIIAEHRELLETLSSAELSIEKYRDEVKKASDALVAQEVLKILRDIPVEEINRDKHGFRIKALRDHGYLTIADVATASAYSLASVHGISDDTAYSIKAIANNIVSQVRQGIKIRLSLDNKTREATQVVLAVSQYRKSFPISRTEYQILKEDLLYIKTCRETVLKEYNQYFKERFVEGKSIRKYAAEHDLNRGSVEHIQRKLITAFANALKQRDDADRQCRLKRDTIDSID